MNPDAPFLSHEISALVHHVELNRAGWWDEALSGIVLASVWSFDHPVNEEYIHSELQKSFKLTVGNEHLSLIISKLKENDSLIEVGGGLLKMSEQLRITLEKDVKEAQQAQMDAQAFFDSLVIDSVIKIDPRTIWEAFERVFLLPMMRDIGASTYQLLVGDGQVYDESHINHFLMSFPNEYRDTIRSIVSSFLDPTNVFVRDYITRKLHAYFCVEASGLPKPVLDKLRNTLSRPLRFRLFVDTNFLFSLLDLHENPSNQSAHELRELLLTLNNNPRVDLYLTSRTMKEAKAAISSAKAAVSTIPTGDNFTLAALRAGMSGMTARFFAERQRRTEPLTAGEWFDPFLNDLVPMARQVGVKAYNKNLDQYGTRQDVIDDIHLVMENEKTRPDGRRKSYERVEHDVVLWHVVEDRRPAYAESPADVEDWVLTVDFRLIGFDAHKRGVSGTNVPRCLHPTTLVQLLRFWVPRSKEFEEAILGGLRFPFLFQEFDAKAERLSLTIISRLGIFNGSDRFSDETLVKVVMNDGLRTRIRNELPNDEEVRLVQDALVDELRLQAAAEEKRTKELQRALENKNTALQDKSSSLRHLRREEEKKDLVITELEAGIASKDRTIDEIETRMCELSVQQRKLTKEMEDQNRRELERSVLLPYSIFLIAAVVVSVFAGLFVHLAIPFFGRYFVSRLLYGIAGIVVFLILHLLFERTLGRVDKFARLRPYLQMARLRKLLWRSMGALLVGIVVNLISGGL